MYFRQVNTGYDIIAQTQRNMYISLPASFWTTWPKPVWAILFLCLTGTTGFAQQNDFISFKKKGRTVANYFKGVPIHFIRKNGDHINGMINRIERDSIFLTFHDVRMIPNQWGTAAPDTIARYDMRFHYNEIAAIPKPFTGLGVIRRGGLFIVGGTTYAVLHTVNGLIQKDKIDPTTIAVSGAVVLAGYGLRKSVKTRYPIGKKYTIEYIRLTE